MKLDPLLQAMSELDEITRRIEALRSHLADAIVTMGDRRDLERDEIVRDLIRDTECTTSMGASEREDLGRMTAPSGSIAGAPCNDPCYNAAEQGLNARPECHTHECALPEERLERIADCGE